jgi:hypothetical protein
MCHRFEFGDRLALSSPTLPLAELLLSKLQVVKINRKDVLDALVLLAEHPLTSGFASTGVPADEGQHLQSVYPTAKVYGGPGKFGFAAEAHLTEASALVSRESAERLFAEWAPHWDAERPILVEKSPPNLIRFRFLQALLAAAAFVAVLRHPLAVAYASSRRSSRRPPS